MSIDTPIQWTDSTCNPTTGCQGCELALPGHEHRATCYAYHLHTNRLAKSLPDQYDASFFNVREIPGRVAKAAAWPDLTGKPRPGKPWVPPSLPRMVFLGDMGDLLSSAASYDFLEEHVIKPCMTPPGSRHVYQFLTKRIARANHFAKWLFHRGTPWPDNVWVGTSLTDATSLPRVVHLARHPARTKFLSIEPMREWFDWRTPVEQDRARDPDFYQGRSLSDLVQWVVVGGESDQGGVRGRWFHLEWADRIIQGCRSAEIPVFVKQLGSGPIYDQMGDRGTDVEIRYLILKDRHGGDWSEWPERLRVREFPGPHRSHPGSVPVAAQETFRFF